MNVFQHSHAEKSPSLVFGNTAINGTFDALCGTVTAINGIFVAHIPHSTSAKVLPTHTRRVRSLPEQSGLIGYVVLTFLFIVQFVKGSR